MENERNVRKFPLRWRKGDQLPEGAVLMRPEQVFEIHKNRLWNWKPWYEAWPFNIGHILLGTSSGFTGIFTVMRFRSALNLGNLAFPSTMLIGAVLPSVLASVMFRMLVSERILTSHFSTSLQAETMAGVTQCVLGAVYPFILAPLVCTAQAQNCKTFAVPTWQEKKAFVDIMKKTLPFKRIAVPILGFHFSLGMFIAQQQWSFFEHKLTSLEANKAHSGYNTSEDLTFR
ncbi:hypothetical protein KUTeg_011777 [Tegillarca granosa]|uniref:Uncharacterized protein n=1 Tax=Tegillarca granosa TaxID=220873 RepID=A0ABQ9F212_TEGGR|nr:hypothetical protein KUTeg_011777 [Tegillarca granosa]